MYRDRIEAWLAEPGHHLIGRDDPDFPPLLRQIPDPPRALYVAGAPALLAAPQLAIVGSRRPSPAGRELAREFAAALTGHGLTVTSGLALGIDGAAHAGAIAAGGRTLAILGNGPDRIYPAGHRELTRQLLDSGGALVSEFPPGSPPRAGHFPRRNRIIAGLSVGTLVVEAARRSGSLITARLAAEQGREVFALPGSVRNPMSRGCHALIRDGAKLVESTADILVELAPLLGAAVATPVATGTETGGQQTNAHPASGAPDDALLAAMGFEAVDIDTLVARTGWPASQVAAGLLVLELGGHVESEPDGQYTRVR